MIILFAGILMAIGILLMTGSGLCSLLVIFGTGQFGGGGIIGLALIVGGVPFLIGLGLAYWGRTLWKKGEHPSLEELDDRFT